MGAYGIGGASPERPFVWAETKIFRRNGAELVRTGSWLWGIKSVRGTADDDLWLLQSTSDTADVTRRLMRWDGAAWVQAWWESEPTRSARTPELWAMTATGGGKVVLAGMAGRTVLWDGEAAREPYRVWGGLEEIEPVGPADVFAFSFAGMSYSHYGSRWNGESWSPTGLGTFDDYVCLTGTAPDDVWASAGGWPEHWDGASWTRHDISRFSALRSTGRNQVWAVGAAGAAAFWDGTRWAQPPTWTTANLRAVWGSNSHDVWAGGETLLHWNGTAWTVAPGIDAAEPLDIRRITGSGPDDAWAVGDAIRHWDGTRWSRVPGPNHCFSVWSAGRNATFLSCPDGFYRREGRGWTRLAFEFAPAAVAGPPKSGFAAMGGTLLRFCR